MFKTKYKEGEEVPVEDAAIADLERSIVSFENDIRDSRSRMECAVKEAARYQNWINDSCKRKRALEDALEKLKE